MTDDPRAVTWSVEDVLALNPCRDYNYEVIQDLWGDREKIGILEVSYLPIPAEHRIWLLCRAPWPAIKPAIMATVARAVRDHALPHDSTRDWAERWLSGEDRTSQSADAAADEASWAAASAAASAAGWATDAAAWAAGGAAAKMAAGARMAAVWAMEAVAEAAEAGGGSRYTERARQVEDFRALVDQD